MAADPLTVLQEMREEYVRDPGQAQVAALDVAIASVVLVTRLQAALVAVIPTVRRRNERCWCDPSRDVLYFGHQPKCTEARAIVPPEG